MICLLNNLQKRKNKSFADGLLAVDGTCCRLYDEVVSRPTPMVLIQIDRDTSNSDKQMVSRLGPSSFRMPSKIAMIWLGGQSYMWVSQSQCTSQLLSCDVIHFSVPTLKSWRHNLNSCLPHAEAWDIEIDDEVSEAQFRYYSSFQPLALPLKHIDRLAMLVHIHAKQTAPAQIASYTLVSQQLRQGTNRQAVFFTGGAPLAQRHVPTVWRACRQRRHALKDVAKENSHAQGKADVPQRQRPAQQGDAKDPQEWERQAAYFAVVYSARAPGKVSFLKTCCWQC